MILLSFDQSLTNVGWSAFDYDTKQLINYGIIQFPDIKDKSNYVEVDQRINEIKRRMHAIIHLQQGEIFAIENTQFQRNADVYRKLSKLLGVISCSLCEADYMYFVVDSASWKSTCKIKGRKRAEQKANAKKFVRAKFGVDVVEDIADAICIGWHIVNTVKLESGK